jgi:hypothetical protein
MLQNVCSAFHLDSPDSLVSLGGGLPSRTHPPLSPPLLSANCSLSRRIEGVKGKRNRGIIIRWDFVHDGQKLASNETSKNPASVPESALRLMRGKKVTSSPLKAPNPSFAQRDLVMRDSTFTQRPKAGHQLPWGQWESPRDRPLRRWPRSPAEL